MANFAEVSQGNHVDLDKITQVIQVFEPTYILVGESITIVDPKYLDNIQTVVSQNVRKTY